MEYKKIDGKKYRLEEIDEVKEIENINRNIENIKINIARLNASLTELETLKARLERSE